MKAMKTVKVKATGHKFKSVSKMEKAMHKLLDYYGQQGVESATRMSKKWGIEAALLTDFESAAAILLEARGLNPDIKLEYDSDMVDLYVPGFLFSLCPGVKPEKLPAHLFKGKQVNPSSRAYTMVNIAPYQ